MGLRSFFNKVFNTAEYQELCSIDHTISVSYAEALKFFRKKVHVPSDDYERMEFLRDHLDEIKDMQRTIDEYKSIKVNNPWAYEYYVKKFNCQSLDKKPSYAYIVQTCDNRENIEALSIWRSASVKCKELAPNAYKWFIKHNNLIEETEETLQEVYSAFDVIVNGEKTFVDYGKVIVDYANGFHWYLKKHRKKESDELEFILMVLSAAEEIVQYDEIDREFNKILNDNRSGVCLYLNKGANYNLDEMTRVCNATTEVLSLQKRWESVHPYWLQHQRGCVELFSQNGLNLTDIISGKLPDLCNIQAIELLEKEHDKAVLYQSILDTFDELIKLRSTRIFLRGRELKYTFEDKCHLFEHKDEIITCEQKNAAVQALKAECKESFGFFFPDYSELVIDTKGLKKAVSQFEKILASEQIIRENSELIRNYKSTLTTYPNGAQLILGEDYEANSLEDCEVVVSRADLIQQAQKDWMEFCSLKSDFPHLFENIVPDYESIKAAIKNRSSLVVAEKLVVDAKRISDAQLAAFNIKREELTKIGNSDLDLKRARLLIYLADAPKSINIPKRLSYDECVLAGHQEKVLNRILRDNGSYISELPNNQFVENWNTLCEIGDVLEKLNEIFTKEGYVNPPVITGAVYRKEIQAENEKDYSPAELLANWDTLKSTMHDRVIAYATRIANEEQEKLIANANKIKEQYAKGYAYLSSKGGLPSSIPNPEQANIVLAKKDEIISENKRILEEERISNLAQQLKRDYRKGFDYYANQGKYSSYASTLDEYRDVVRYENSIKSKHREIEEEERKQREIREKCQRYRSLLSQWKDEVTGLPYYYLVIYYPYRVNGVVFNVTASEREDQKYVWNFKDGMSWVTSSVAEKISSELTSRFGSSCSDLTLFCIPASTSIKNDIRYREFCRLVSEKCGITNSHSHINITSDGGARHEGGTGDVEVSLDSYFFRDKYVILFDDVVTTGRSMRRYQSILESMGAHVIGVMSIGKTKHTRY